MTKRAQEGTGQGAQVLSYGEDPLTYWVLTQRLQNFLGQLSDDSSPADVLVVYRPSFGRGGSAKATASGSPRSEFGEFDAIVRSTASVYLVEAKWTRSSEHTAGQIVLRPQQVLRHQVFRWHLQAWVATRASGWGEFYGARNTEFAASFPGFTLAPAGSILAANLEFVLRKLCDTSRPVRDILLHIGLPGAPKPVSVRPADFDLVHVEAEAVSPEGYFRLQ